MGFSELAGLSTSLFKTSTQSGAQTCWLKRTYQQRLHRKAYDAQSGEQASRLRMQAVGMLLILSWCSAPPKIKGHLPYESVVFN